MRKLIVFLTILTLVFLGMSSNIFAAASFVNVGPTTDFNGDIGIIDEIQAEGSSDDEFETTLTFTDPTADRTITVPDSDQTIGTATAIEDGLILEVDLDADEGAINNDILTFDDTGDNFSWQTPAELNLVVTVGTPSDSQVGVWTGDGTLEGDASFTYDGSNIQFTGDLGSTGTKITKGWFTDLTVANDITGDITGNAVTITISDNESSSEENEVPFVANASAPGENALESDSGFTYDPNTGILTAAGFAGALTGNADTVTVTNSTSDTTTFLLLGESDAGNLEPKTDATLTYNADTGLFFATIITGEIRLVTSDADPNTTGEIKHDSTAAGFTGGILRWFDNDTSRMIVDLETDAADDNYVVAYDADADGFYMKVDSFDGNFFLHLMDMDAASTTYVHAAITGSGSGQDISTAITNPDYGRNITVTTTNNNTPSGNVTITGTLADGTTSATDVITISAGATAQGVKAFVYVSNINIPAGVPVEDTVAIGIGDLIGLPNSVSAEADVYMKTVDGVEEYGEISGNVNTTNNTLNAATIIQNEDITVLYHG